MTYMSEREICSDYRNAKDRNEQIKVMAELNGIDRMEVMRILVKNGERLTCKVSGQLERRLDTLNGKIAKLEQEYHEITWLINGGKENV